MTIEHLAIIMDGNGRWAKNRGLKRSEGHKQGSEAARKILTRARELNIPYLTLYALSRENLQRPKEELTQLFSLLADFVANEVPSLIKHDIRLHCIGDFSALPFSTQKAIQYAINKTSTCNSMHLCLALAYSAREEIARAFIKMQQENVSYTNAGEVVQSLHKFLDAPNFPDPDLIIRTGGDCRLSNFLLYQAAYSELYFTPVYFPDFDEHEFQKALDDFHSRQRKFGKTDEQIA